VDIFENRRPRFDAVKEATLSSIFRDRMFQILEPEVVETENFVAILDDAKKSTPIVKSNNGARNSVSSRFNSLCI